MPDNYPHPVGYRMLVKPLKREARSKGGILLADETQQNDIMLNTVGMVMAMGPDCYNDTEKFPTGAWCSVGCWVAYRKHAGTVVNVIENDGEQTRLVFVADDEILAVTDSPESIIAYIP